jgi:hypothetical protein
MTLHSYYVPDDWLCNRCEYIDVIKETETTGHFTCTKGITTCNGLWCNECREFKDKFEGLPHKTHKQVEEEWSNMFRAHIAVAHDLAK